MSGGNVAREPSQLERLAYHEAGHAIVNHLVGAQISSVTITPRLVAEGVAPGGCLAVLPATDRFQMHHEVQMYFAGGIAERLAFGQDGWRDHSMWDFLQIDELLEGYQHTPDGQQWAVEFTAVQADLAERYLRDHWPAVKRVAHALLQQRTLSGLKTHQIIASVIRPKGTSRSSH